MKLARKVLCLISILVAPTLSHSASPDCYVVNFTKDNDRNSQMLNRELYPALAIAGVSAELVTVDTSSVAKWEKSAHEMFDRDIIPVFNKWVGLPGFAAIVDAHSKRVMGCVDGKFSSYEIAEEIRRMCTMASGNSYGSRASVDWSTFDKNSMIVKTSTPSKTTQCPAARNVDPND